MDTWNAITTLAILMAVLTFPREVTTEGDGLTSQFGNKDYTEYRPGHANSRVIISTSHGGYLLPEDIPDRQHGCYDTATGECTWTHGCGATSETHCRAVTLRDKYTQEMAELLTEELGEILGCRPHLIINHLGRIKLDPNREIKEATQGNADAEQAWADFHDFMKEAKTTIGDKGGVLFDIHGQTHKEDWIEIGYLMTGTKHLDPDDLIFSSSSIRNLAFKVSSQLDFETLLRGSDSLGKLLNDAGYRAIPSPNDPRPNGVFIYTGGYIMKTHGSRDGGAIDGIQLEFPKSLRNSTATPANAPIIAEALGKFIETFYISDNGDNGVNFGTNNYVEYRPGGADSAVIITVANGGALEPEDIPDRTHGCYDTVTEECIWEHDCGTPDSSHCKASLSKETNSKHMADEMTVAIEKCLGSKPHLVISHLKRSKMDVNNEKEEGSMGVAAAEVAWQEFHDYIEEAKDAIGDEKYKLLIDVHGHGHSEDWIELGYLVTKSRLNSNNLKHKYSSIRGLFNRVEEDMDFDTLLRGEPSLGAEMNNVSYRAVPSPDEPSPGSKSYYSGSYIPKIHGSKYGGNCDAVAMYLPFSMRGTSVLQVNACRFSKAIGKFLHTFYNGAISNADVQCG